MKVSVDPISKSYIYRPGIRPGQTRPDQRSYPANTVSHFAVVNYVLISEVLKAIITSADGSSQTITVVSEPRRQKLCSCRQSRRGWVIWVQFPAGPFLLFFPCSSSHYITLQHMIASPGALPLSFLPLTKTRNTAPHPVFCRLAVNLLC